MKIVRVAYRASFEFPKAETPLNPSGWKCPGEIALEVFESSGGHWKARGAIDQREIKHWAFNDPLPRTGKFKDAPPIEGRADGGPVAAGQPVVVGESGPKVVVPQADATVIPNGRDMARRAALRKGDIDSYIKLLWRY